MRLHTLIATAVCSALFSAHASAASVTYLLNQTNANPTLSDNVAYAQITIDDTTAGALTFTVTPLSALTSLLPHNNFGIQEFGFNVVGSHSLVDASGTNAQWTLPGGWSANLPPPINQEDGFGRFELAVKGTGSVRQDPLIFQVKGTSLTIGSFAEVSSHAAAEGNVFFAAHIAGFTVGNGETGAYFGGSTAVPLPTALWLFAPALGGLIARRKRAA